MITGATLFTGGGGVDLGMRAAGIETAWGIEYDPQIAEVARANGVPVTVQDILDANPMQFERVGVLHASPPCPNFSTAKVGATETAHDIEMAGAVCRFVETLLPNVFTLENVYAYRKAQGFRRILETLRRSGYWYTFSHINSADYGVPQTRMRLILRAVRYGLVTPLPAPEPWVGWYASIEDLIDELPESQFAPWQLARLPEAFRSLLVANGGFDGAVVTRELAEPAFTVTANSNQTGVRAFVVAPNSNPQSRGGNVRYEDEPNCTITPNANGRMRAFMVTGQYAQPNSVPDRRVQVVEQQQPSLTVTASYAGDWKGWLEQGRVVAMTPRALARFQSFPDSYELPDASGLACRVVGNAVPPVLYQKIIQQLAL